MQVKKLLELEPELVLNAGKDKEYKMKVIKYSIVYANKIVRGQFSGLYYLVSWEGHLEDENI